MAWEHTVIYFDSPGRSGGHHEPMTSTPNVSISAEHPDAQTYRRAADAFRSKDLETLAETIAEDVVWHVPGTTWFARQFVGRGNLLAYLGEIMERTAGTFKLIDVLVSACDDHVVAVQRFGFTVGTESQEFACTSVMRFVDGRQAERWFHFHDLDAFDAFVSQI